MSPFPTPNNVYLQISFLVIDLICFGDSSYWIEASGWHSGCPLFTKGFLLSNGKLTYYQSNQSSPHSLFQWYSFCCLGSQIYSFYKGLLIYIGTTHVLLVCDNHFVNMNGVILLTHVHDIIHQVWSLHGSNVWIDHIGVCWSL